MVVLGSAFFNTDEADRISGFLRTQAIEHISTAERRGGEAVGSESIQSIISEAQRWREELKKARVETASTPVQVARAFMGRRNSSMTPLSSLRSVDREIGSAVIEARAMPGSRQLGCRNHQSPSSHLLIGPSTQALGSTIREEGWMSAGHLRKAQESVIHSVKPSMYSSQAWPNIVSPPIQSSYTALKILDTLEKLPLSPKGGMVGGEFKLQMEKAQEKYEHKEHFSENLRFSNKLDFESLVKTPMKTDISHADALSSDEISSNSLAKEVHSMKDEIVGKQSLSIGNLVSSQDNVEAFPIAATSNQNEPILKENIPVFPLGPVERPVSKDKPIAEKSTALFASPPSSESNSNPTSSGPLAGVPPVMGDELIVKENTLLLTSSENNRNSTSLGQGMPSMLLATENNRNSASLGPFGPFISASGTSTGLTLPASKEEGSVEQCEGRNVSQTSSVSTPGTGLNPLELGSSSSESSFSFKVTSNISSSATIGIPASVSTIHPFALSGTLSPSPFTFSKFSSIPNSAEDPSIAIDSSDKLGSSCEVAPLPACVTSLEGVHSGSMDQSSHDQTFTFASQPSSSATFSGPIGSLPSSGSLFGPAVFGGLASGTTFQVGGGPASGGGSNGSEKTHRKTVKTRRRK
jgi:hypothetical protein